MSAFSVLEAGMMTGVGFDAPSSCAAIRCGITGFEETGFMFAGDWLVGCPVPFEEPWRGREKLLGLAVPPIQECLAGVGSTRAGEIPLLLCVAEEDRPGRFADLDESFLRDVEQRLGVTFHSRSEILAGGRIAGVRALARARRHLAAGTPYCIVAGVDTYLVAGTLTAFNDKRRLLTPDNPNGFIPGEAGAAALLGPARNDADLVCPGLGFGTEPAPIESGEPLRADGLLEAIRATFTDAGLGYEQVDFRITDVSGEQYAFKEAALAVLRSMRVRKGELDIWHPTDCVGQVGAAIVPLVLGVALAAARKRYAPGPGALCHFSGDDAQRASFVLRSNFAEAS